MQSLSVLAVWGLDATGYSDGLCAGFSMTILIGDGLANKRGVWEERKWHFLLLVSSWTRGMVCWMKVPCLLTWPSITDLRLVWNFRPLSYFSSLTPLQQKCVRWYLYNTGALWQMSKTCQALITQTKLISMINVLLVLVYSCKFWAEWKYWISLASSFQW